MKCKITTLFISLLAVLISACSKEESKSPIKDYNIVWNAQSKNSGESMPLAGGNMGCNVWVENNDLLFYFSSPGARDENGALLKFGRTRVNFEPNIFENSKFKQTLNLADGAVYIETESAEYGKATVKLWVEINRPVIHSEIESDFPVVVSTTYENWRYTPILLEQHAKNTERGMAFGNYEDYPDEVYVYPDNFEAKENEMLFYHRMREDKNVFHKQVKQQSLEEIQDELYNPMTDLTFGGVLKSDDLQYVAETEGVYAETPFKGWKYQTNKPVKSLNFKIYTHINQTESLDIWKDELQAIIDDDKADQKVWRENIEWWNQFWNRSHIVINRNNGEGDRPWEIARNYQLFRYMLVSGFYSNEPLVFNGGVFTFDPGYERGGDRFGQGYIPDQRRWGALFTAQNQRLVAWPKLKTGDFDGIVPSFEFYRKILPTTRSRTKFYWGHDGCSCGEQIAMTGLPGMSQYGYNDNRVKNFRYRPDDFEVGVASSTAIGKLYESQLEFSWMMLEYYNYSGNDISQYIPFIEQAVIFYDEHYRMRNKQISGNELGENGKLVIYPANTLEGHPDCKNPTSVIAGLTAVLNRLVNLPDTMQGADKKNRWHSILSTLPDYPTGTKEGKIYLKPAEDYTHISWHMPEMFPLYPYQLFGLGMDNLDLIRNTFLNGDITEERRMQDVSWHQGAIHFARLGMTDKAVATMSPKLANGPYRFPAFSLGTVDYAPDHNRSGCGMVALQEMLFQTHGEKIHLFPAWPVDWDVDFKLHAPQNTIVSGKLVDGELKGLKVIPESRKDDIILHLKK
jgi:hypothetical protein